MRSAAGKSNRWLAIVLTGSSVIAGLGVAVAATRSRGVARDVATNDEARDYSIDGFESQATGSADDESQAAATGASASTCVRSTRHFVSVHMETARSGDLVARVWVDQFDEPAPKPRSQHTVASRIDMDLLRINVDVSGGTEALRAHTARALLEASSFASLPDPSSLTV